MLVMALMMTVAIVKTRSISNDGIVVHGRCLRQDFSISSRERPLVSGIMQSTKKKAAAEQPA